MSGKLNSKAIALAGGIMWAICLLILGIGSLFISSWQSWVNILGQLYIGYSPTLTGSLTGAVLGFLDFFIGLYVFCWLYNYFSERLS